MSKLNIGVLGCASVAERMVIPAIQESESFNLIAIASRDASKALRFADRFDCEAVTGYQRLLDRQDIDAVYSPLPCGLQYEWVARAIACGKHVLAEKSLSTDSTNVRGLCELAHENGVLIDENFMFCHHRQIGLVKEIIEAKLGDLRVLRCSFGFPPLPPHNIRYSAALGGGALLDAGAYTIKASSIFLGENLEVRAASIDTGATSEVDTGGSAMLSDNSGQVSFASFGFEHYYQCEVEFWGSQGKITMDRAFTAGPGITPRIVLEQQGERHEYIVPADNHFRNKLDDFAAVIKTGSYDATYSELLTQARLLEEVKVCGSE